jgi:hypothetical protein
MSINNIILNVPCETITSHFNRVATVCSISRFHLNPSITEKWITTIIDDEGKHDEISSLSLKFMAANESNSGLERIQRAILIMSIEKETKEGTWRFVGDGIVIPDTSSEKKFKVSSQLIDGEELLYVVVDNVSDTGSDKDKVHYINVEFLFIAECKNKGNSSIHLSTDPSVGVGRPKGNG